MDINGVRRFLRGAIDPFCLSEVEFRKKFRLSKALVRALIVELRPYIYSSGRKGSLSVETKVFTALNFYATGSYQRCIAESYIHCLGRSTAGECIREVTNALNKPEVQKRWITFPKTKEERRKIIKRNVDKFGIPNVLGYVDGTEVSIVTPHKALNPQCYWTRKHHYALNCQIICDSDLKIMNVVANHPGSCTDKYIFKNCAARRCMRRAFTEEPCWLLGDSGYTLEPWCIIPILDAEPGSNEESFTKRHCQSRNCVERCIGVLKGRFRCLLKDRVLHYDGKRAGEMVKACCVLHNMCMDARLPEPEVDEAVEGEEDGIPWVLQEHEAEDEEAEAAADARLIVDPNDRNITRVAEEVRNRLVEFLVIDRLLRQEQQQ
ncbi:Putative nuclease [Frankliniella fusca]|uniref:Nuclease n=1 Tax=Frankliniella fusca TaxID=407009 RepID=A0AAE1LJC3_9NEOP|nr:Putative nuclease [Frankliniella fusca]